MFGELVDVLLFEASVFLLNARLLLHGMFAEEPYLTLASWEPFVLSVLG